MIIKLYQRLDTEEGGQLFTIESDIADTSNGRIGFWARSYFFPDGPDAKMQEEVRSDTLGEAERDFLLLVGGDA